MSNCPSRWSDLTNDIQVNWTAPERPNGVLLRYYIVLTSFDGGRVIVSASINDDATVTLSVELSNTNLSKCCKVYCICNPDKLFPCYILVFHHLLLFQGTIETYFT